MPFCRTMSLVSLLLVIASFGLIAPPAQASPVNQHARLPHISGFGDSVMLGAKQDLLRTFHGGHVNAAESRQAGPTLAAAEKAARQSRLGKLVVIHTGTNGTIEKADLERGLRVVSADRRVRRILVLTDHCQRPWERSNNKLIGRVTKKFHKANVVAWNYVGSRHPSWFYSDGIHLTPAGATGYAQLVKRSYLQDR